MHTIISSSMSFTIGRTQDDYQLLILSHKSNIVLIYKSKDLRKLQQNLFYKLPECFMNDRIQRKK